MDVDDGGAGLDCVVCFDPVRESTVLPCACTVVYCASCWDRSLARSFQQSGQARCPTCRANVRVDFDARSQRLVFSRDNVLDGAGDARYRSRAGRDSRRVTLCRQQAISRLTEQALPVQVSLLQEYGTAFPELGAMARDPYAELILLPVCELKRHIAALGGDATNLVEKGELVGRLREVAGDPLTLVVYWAKVGLAAPPPPAASAATGAERPRPRCVCGGWLESLAGDERAKRHLEKRLPQHPRGTQVFESYFHAQFETRDFSGVICDLCDRPLPLSAGMWSCENGDSTILHATHYDVCDRCFARHASGLASQDAHPMDQG